MTKLTISLSLIFIALLERVFFDLGPNVELVTVTMLLSAIYLGRKYSSLVVLSTLIISDLIIGNSNIAFFTWSGFIIPALIIPKIFNKSAALKNIFTGTSIGIGANLFFYFWTNLGVWLLSSMYPDTAQGLLMSYVNGLPFLKLQLLSTIIFAPLGIAIFEFSKVLLSLPLYSLRNERA